MSFDVSMVKIALAAANGILSYAPTAVGSDDRVSFAVQASIFSTASRGGASATAVPATQKTNVRVCLDVQHLKLKSN